MLEFHWATLVLMGLGCFVVGVMFGGGGCSGSYPYEPD